MAEIWKDGTEVTFTATGKVVNGQLAIGCQEFVQADIAQYTTVTNVVAPKVAFQSGDIYVDNLDEIRTRDSRGVWRSTDGAIQAESDEQAQSHVDCISRYRFVVIGGKVVI